MSDDTPQERQDNEIEALKAIFGDELKDLRKPQAWSVWCPLDILLTLFPQQGSMGNQEIHCTVDLRINCPHDYPEVVPELEIKHSKGLSDVQISELLNELKVLASKLKGEVMIFELAQHVQTYLHSYNKPGFKSFYDEMLVRQQQTEETKLRDQQVKEDRERREIKDEIMRRQEILRSEMKLRKEPRLSLTQDNTINENMLNLGLMAVNPVIERTRTNSTRKRLQSTSESSDSSYCEHRGTKLINFSFKGDRQVNRGRCLGHSERGCVVYAGLDVTTGELFAISEWSMKVNTSGGLHPPSPRIHNKKKDDSPTKSVATQYDIAFCLKHMASIEQELSFLMKLHHTNLVHYVNIKYGMEDDSLVVYLLQEFVLGGNISSLYLSDRVVMEVDMLRHFATGLLEAIDFLHRNNVVHKDLRETNVFIDKNGSVRLADYSLDRRMMELCSGGNQGGRYSKKQDIFRVGMLFLSLLKGSIVTENEIQIPNSLSQDLKDFLSRCLDVNERTRWASDQLLKHQFIKTPIEKPSPQQSEERNSNAGSDDIHGDSPEAMDIQLFIPTGANGQSRIKNEFEILKWLGKGAFGDVLKVKNKLDGGCYAIKRIELNPKNKQLNKKITREVKLLSRLNHENVVRYYNSWIESGTQRENDNSSSSSPTTNTQTSSEKHQPHVLQPIETIDKNQDVEQFAPPAHSMEWSVSYTSKSFQHTAMEEESSSGVDTSESEDDDEDLITYLRDMKNSSSSDSIEFKCDDELSTSRNDCNSVASSQERVDNNKGIKMRSPVEDATMNVSGHESTLMQFQYLYIQMEFCEKSTLRNAIDNGLHLDLDRMWRLFREIVEGLSHIHQQGMIHRDLKPVNIFLDSNDHVKIGDFGLATNILPRPSQSVFEHKSPHDMDSYSQDIGDGSLTGQVGTALYVAPELMMTGNKAIYNQKVDIYSLGIILFEMSYMPLKTGMERVKTLGNLRLKDIVLPENFDVPENSKLVYLIKWLLNHDVSGRPTCTEILQWDLPGHIEEYELREVLRHALMNTDSKAYRHLINACFQQELTPAEDITYDMNLLKVASHHRQPLLLTTSVKETVIKIFKLHGGVELSPPLLLPRCRLYDQVDSSVRLMTHSGGVVHIPHDLRVSFARYVVLNGITMLKRYSIEKVYREKKIFGFHPRELYECAFDIVTPTPGNLFAEAELLSIVCEIANEFPAMKTKNLTIRLNHTSLLKAVLMNCGIEPEKYNDIYTIFSDARDGKLSKFQVQTHLISLCLSDHAMVGLFSLMETECTVDKLGHVLKSFLKRKGEANVLAREGLKELETIVFNAEALGVKYPIVISPCMVYNINQYSGMMCQFVCELKKKRRKTTLDVIAAGGRYDSMLNDMRKKVQHTGLGDRNDVSTQAAVGISLSLERLVQGAVGGGDECESLKPPDSDVCVYATASTKHATREKAQIVNTLWNAGIRASLLEVTNPDEIQEACRELNVTHVIVVSDSEQGTVRVRSWDRDRFQECKIPINEIVEFVQRLVKTWNDDSSETTWVSNNTVPITKTESRVNFSDYDRQSSYNMPLVNFVTPEKLAANARKRYEIQILGQMSNTLQRFSAKTRVDILAISVDSSVLRSLATYLEADVSQEMHDRAVRNIIEKHQRHKKYLEKICDEFRDSVTDKSKPVVALYSLNDSIFKIIL